jgi:hypothetical protein
MTTTSIQTDTVHALCDRIQAAAIKCEAYHVFVDWQPHVASLSVCVRDKRTDYSADVDTWPDVLMSERVYLDADWCDPIADLTAIIDQLQRLGVEV